MEVISSGERLMAKLGVKDYGTIMRWRARGMPSTRRGNAYIYVWEDVTEWLRATGQEGWLMPSTNGSSNGSSD